MFLFICTEPEILYYENFDIQSVVTPVNPETLRDLLQESQYDAEETQFLYDSFKYGFSICYEGSIDAKITSQNLKFNGVGNETVLWNKVMKEVKLHRYAGPFKEIPFQDHFIQSPIGLVPKDGGADTRLIFHLSHPRGRGTSVNANTPEDLCKVVYPMFDDAIKLCLKEGRDCKLGKSDAKAAFRNLGIRPEDFWLLVMKAKSPIDGKFYYFVDKALPFGASISCSHFQRVSNGIAHIIKYRAGRPNVNYLDDFLFAALMRLHCNRQIQTFLDVCEQVGMPVNFEKTFWATTCLTFLGLLINTVSQTVSIPRDKIEKAHQLIDKVLLNKSRKLTLHQLQQICGYLNFLCKAVVPGRAFTRRICSHTSGVLKPHHHIKITEEMKLDLEMWKIFLRHPSAYCRPFLDFSDKVKSTDIDFYTDASGKIGFGGVCQNSFMFEYWDRDFLSEQSPSIDYLELYAVAAAVLAWISRFRNRRVTIFTDNKGVRDMINSNVASTKNSMVLIRIIVLKCLVENVKLKAKYVASEDNNLADHLSRGRIKQFRKDSKGKYEKDPTAIPNEIWPIDKVWQKKLKGPSN